MEALYYLEHKVLPLMIYKGKEKYGLDVFDLARSFGKICAAAVENYNTAAKKTDGPAYKEEDFQVDAVPYGDKEDAREGKPGGYVLRFYFPFAKNKLPICRRAYIVIGPQGESPLYYTVEYSQKEDKFTLCAWDKNLCHVEFGDVDDCAEEELKRIMEVDQHRPELQQAVEKAIRATVYNSRK